jgi:hypothetical protein
MNTHRSRSLVGALACLLPLVAAGQNDVTEVQQLREEVRSLQQRIEALEGMLSDLAAGRAPATDGARGMLADIPTSPDGEIDEDAELDELPSWLKALRERNRGYGLEFERRRGQLATRADAEDYAGPGEPELELDLGGAVWINYAHQAWKGDDEGRKDDLRFDNLRLALDSTYGDFVMSAQYRFYSFTRALHHAWIGYEFEEDNRVELGISQVPFGILPFASHNFWFNIPYYVGLEDDYDAGIKWHYGEPDNWTLDLAFYLNEEYSDPTDLDRYSVDVVRSDDQQNDERNQINLRLAYDWEFSDRAHTEFGISGRYGQLDNRITEKTGDYWAGSLHANAFYGPWNLMLEAMRYEYDPENPAGVDDDLILMGNLGSKRLVASEANIYVGNIAYDFGPVWGPIRRLNCYNDYSYMQKDENSFEDSQINITGCVADMGPFWTWIDLINGKNAWYLNDSETDSGFGPGGTDDWETRFNVSFEWYF